MTLAAGTRLGVHEVVSALGAGGMGEVYRAKDTRLGRSVALKTLPPEFALDPERDLVQVLRRSPEGKLACVDEVSAEDDGVLTTPLLPGWQRAMRTLLAEPA